MPAEDFGPPTKARMIFRRITRQRLCAEGVSEEDAIQICNRMTDDVLWRTAVEEATLRNAPLVDDKAQLSLQILKMNLLNRGLQLTPGVIKSVLKTYHISETVVKPESLEIGAHFRLTGDACNSEERDNKHIYEVTNQNLDCKLGAHLIVKDETGIEQEMRIMPWVPVIRIG